MEYRFLDEYANHKKREVKKYAPDKLYADKQIEKINKTVWMVRRGYIILDEGMRLLSEF